MLVLFRGLAKHEPRIYVCGIRAQNGMDPLDETPICRMTTPSLLSELGIHTDDSDADDFSPEVRSGPFSKGLLCLAPLIFSASCVQCLLYIHLISLVLCLPRSSIIL